MLYNVDGNTVAKTLKYNNHPYKSQFVHILKTINYNRWFNFSPLIQEEFVIINDIQFLDMKQYFLRMKLSFPKIVVGGVTIITILK